MIYCSLYCATAAKDSTDELCGKQWITCESVKLCAVVRQTVQRQISSGYVCRARYVRKRMYVLWSSCWNVSRDKTFYFM